MVYAPGTGTLGLRWCAAELDGTVRAMVETWAGTLPSGWVLHRHGRQRLPLAAGAQGRLLLSAVIDLLLRRFADASGEAETTPRGRDDAKVRALFFGAGQARLDGPGEGAVAGSIQTWLSRLHLGTQTHRPVLQLDEADDGQGFELSLAVADEHSRLDAPTPLATVISKPAWAARRLAVLKTVALLAEFHPPLNDYVRDGARRPLALRPEQLPPLLLEALPALRRALEFIDEASSAAWMRPSLMYSVREALDRPWVLHIDASIKPLYGRQEGVEIGYNPAKPMRPSHVLHTFLVSNLRLVLDVQVSSGKQRARQGGAGAAPGRTR
jgi:hypothetical protein